MRYKMFMCCVPSSSLAIVFACTREVSGGLSDNILVCILASVQQPSSPCISETAPPACHVRYLYRHWDADHGRGRQYITSAVYHGVRSTSAFTARTQVTALYNELFIARSLQTTPVV